MENIRRFYKALGNLFYAIAAADKKIRPEEKQKLQDEIQFAWKHYEDSTDRFGTDRAHLAEFEFETLEDADMTAGEAYQLFLDYFEDYQAEIDLATRKRIFNSARHIAESVRKINEAELEYLVKLKKILGV